MSSTKDQNQDGGSKSPHFERDEREENEKRRYLMELNCLFFVEGPTRQSFDSISTEKSDLAAEAD